MVEMTDTEEKIWAYIVNRKSPVTQKQVIKHFLISQSKASAALNFFVEQGIADVTVIGKVKYYKVKD